MSDTVTPTLQADVYPAVLTFLTAMLPAGVPIIQGLPNRTAMPPPSPGFVVFQAIHKRRLRTAIDAWDTTDPTPTEQTVEQGLELSLQIDCYGASSSDWADTITTLWRDEAGCTALSPSCQPLYADEARLISLVDAEEQYEERWSIDATLQYNPVVTIQQQFADELAVVLKNVEVLYPP